MYILFPEFLSQQLQCTNYDILLGLPNFLSLFFLFSIYFFQVFDRSQVLSGILFFRTL